MGEPPLWYRVVRAAKFLGVPPWDLASAPADWLYMAEAASAAEAAAEQARRTDKAGGRGGRGRR